MGVISNRRGRSFSKIITVEDPNLVQAKDHCVVDKVKVEKIRRYVTGLTKESARMDNHVGSSIAVLIEIRWVTLSHHVTEKERMMTKGQHHPHR